jgi:hypothetical protein
LTGEQYARQKPGQRQAVDFLARIFAALSSVDARQMPLKPAFKLLVASMIACCARDADRDLGELAGSEIHLASGPTTLG